MDGLLMRKRKFIKINQGYKKYVFIRDSEDVVYDYAHWHLTIEGEIKTEKERVESLHMLIRWYERILQRAERFPKPYQSWILIEDRLENCHYDAIYFHTQNPNSDNFPDRFEYVIWDIPVPDRWKNVFDLNLYRFGKVELDDEIKYFLIRKEFCKRGINSYGMDE